MKRISDGEGVVELGVDDSVVGEGSCVGWSIIEIGICWSFF